MRCWLVFVVCLAYIAMVAGGGRSLAQKEKPNDTKAGARAGRGRFALLVGVTDYPHLNKELWLEGGANDVLLMKELLTKKYEFPPENIVILSEAEGKKNPSRLPTRENIRNECRRLAEKVKADDQVVVLLSGHGSRHPEEEGVKDPQPDGFDKVFLPRDVSEWNYRNEKAPKTISGRDLGNWLRPIPKKDALLWVIVDACHSGQMLRGVREKVREVDLVKGLKFPVKVIQKAEQRAKKRAAKNGEKTRGKGPIVPFPLPLAREKGVVLTYACQSRQVTVEGRYKHPEREEEHPYGLLTYTINCILRSSPEALTYRELLLRVQGEYTKEDRDFPTPVMEGTEQNRAILGRGTSEPHAALLVSAKGKKLTVNAGQLHGLTRGTILAVKPPPGMKGGLLGYLRVTAVMPVRAVVEPTKYEKAKMPAAEEIVGGLCEVVEVAYDDLIKQDIAVDRIGSKAKAEDLDRLGKTLTALAERKDSPIKHVDQKQARWLVRLTAGKVYVLPAAEWKDERDKKAPRRLFGPANDDAQLAKWLKERFARIVRARTLIKMAGKSASQGERGSLDFQAQVKVSIVRTGETASTPDSARSIRTLYQGDVVQFRVQNTGKVPVDLTILYVNNRFGIEALFPKFEDNRLEVGKTLTTPPIDIDDETAGLEHVVIIAVKSEGETPVDFVSLAQPTIEGARGLAKTRGTRGTRGLGSPFGQLLQKAMYGEGNKTRAKRREIENFTFQLRDVLIEAGKRP